jgi:hypothetical protein
MNINLNNDITNIRYLFYGFVIFIFCRFYYLNLLLHQFESPIINFPDADNTFWLILFLGIPQFLAKNFTISLLFDASLFILPILCIIYKKSRILPLVFFFFNLLYFISVSSFQAHHAHNLNGILILSILFCFRPNTFVPLFHFLRYYTMFVMVSAACWKIFRSSIFHLEHMSNTFFALHLNTLSDHPASTYSIFIKYLMDHPTLSQSIFILGTLIQSSFLIGFFTKKYDRLLIILFLCFFSGDYVFNELSFIEFYVFLIPLMKWKELKSSFILLKETSS